jgi:N-acetylmuramoyl-L-alanine amidase
VKKFATFLASVLLASGLCGPAQASAAFAFHMVVPKLLSGKPTAPVVREIGLEKYCLALAIYHEARGEPLPGQFAVAVTILNRVRSNAYPDTICGVVYQNAERLHRCQFSFACDRRSDVPKNAAVFAKSMDLAVFTTRMKSRLERDPDRPSLFAMLGAMTHYHRYDVKPSWSKKLDRLTRIGNHVFFKSERVMKKYRRPAHDAPVQVAAAGY